MDVESDSVVVTELKERRNRIAQALANPSRESVYLASEDPSEVVRLRLAKEYVMITEEIMECEGV
jgi:hypothetical protein